MKFGGTSMGDAHRLRVAAEIIEEQHKQRPLVVVVSAMSKVTDLLLETLRHAEVGDRPAVESTIEALSRRHQEACRALAADASADVESLISEFRRIANGILMLGERPPRSVDEAIAVGERLSAVILSQYLRTTGVPAEAVSGGEVIVTDAVFGNASPQMPATKTRCAERLLPLIGQDIVPIVTGFNGATADGRPTTLGRGRLRFFRFDPGGRAGCRGTLDLDRRRRNHDSRSADCSGCCGAR